MKISTTIAERLLCPACMSPIRRQGSGLVCRACGSEYPVISGIPILIDETTTNFRIENYSAPQRRTHFRRLRNLAKAALPKLSLNVAARKNYRRFHELLLLLNPEPRVLVIGGATAGEGMSELLNDPRIDFVESDVAIDERTTLVCDAHKLPFADQTFDGVIIQAVMFNLAEYRCCIREMNRILRPGGLLYSEMPFMEQIVGGEFDFYRFTLNGHQYQFRDFEKIDSGISGGPAMATAWSIEYLLLSFTENQLLRGGIKAFCKCTLFWLKYLDPMLVRKRGAVDAAAGTYFLGRRPQTTEALPPIKISIPEYTGLIPADARPRR